MHIAKKPGDLGWVQRYVRICRRDLHRKKLAGEQAAIDEAEAERKQAAIDEAEAELSRAKVALEAWEQWNLRKNPLQEEALQAAAARSIDEPFLQSVMPNVGYEIPFGTPPRGFKLTEEGRADAQRALVNNGCMLWSILRRSLGMMFGMPSGTK